MRACLIPLATEPLNPAANIERLVRRLDEVARHQPDLICLPEGGLTGYLYEEDDLARFAETVPGPTSERIGHLARRHRAYFCFGLLECAESGVYNSAVLVDRTGKIILRHRKIEEKPPFIVGDTVDNVDTDLGRLGILICGDLFDEETVNELDRSLDLLIVPMSRPFDEGMQNIDHWISRERQLYLEAVRGAGVPTLIVNALEINTDDPSFGGAMIVSADGELLAESPVGTDKALIWDFSADGS